MVCPNCGASSNNFGVWQGSSTTRCIRCGFDYNAKGEMSFRQGLYNEDKAKNAWKGKIYWEDEPIKKE